MPVSIGPRIQVDGEEEYRRQISGIIEQSKTLDAEMKAMAAGFSDTATEQEKAAAASGKLAEQMELARRRTELVREMTEKSAEATGENSTQTLKWRQALAAAEEQQATLEHAVEENTRAIDAQGDEMADSSEKIATLGDQVSGLAEKFGIRIPEGVKNALDNVDGFSTGTVAAMGAAVAGIGAVELAIKGISAGIEAVKQLNELTLEQAARADELLTRSSQTGLGVELLQQLDYAAKFIDFDGLDKSLVKITQSMGEAAKGTEKQTEAFAALGVSIKDDVTGELRDNWDVFEDTIDALGKVENETQRDIIANALFGKSYSELKPLIDAGTDALKERMDMADVASKEEIEALGRVDDAHQQYESTLERVKQKIAVEFAPTSEAALTKFGDLAERAGNMLVESGIIDKVGKLVEPLGKIAETGLDIASAVLPALVGPLDTAASLFNALAQGVQDAWEKAQAFYSWLSEKDSQWQLNDSSGYYVDGFDGSYGYNAAGDMDWRGGLTWVGESGPELVSLPRGSAIYSNQESRQIAAAATDTSRIESLLERCLQRMDGIERELADGEAVRRMA